MKQIENICLQGEVHPSKTINTAIGESHIYGNVLELMVQAPDSGMNNKDCNSLLVQAVLPGGIHEPLGAK